MSKFTITPKRAAPAVTFTPDEVALIRSLARPLYHSGVLGARGKSESLADIADRMAELIPPPEAA